MNEVPGLLLAIFAGLILGTVFFGGLWWTVRRGLSSSQAGLWFLVSFLLRTAIVVAGFWWAARGDWRRIAAYTAGFIFARYGVVRVTRVKEGT